MDPGRTVQINVDPNRTVMGAPPTLDPNKTIMGNAPDMNMTVTIKPVQCPVCRTFNPPGLIYCGECGLIFEMALPDDAFGAPTVQLPVLVDSSGREHKLRPGSTVLGRQGDIQVEDSRASRRHAQVESSPAGMTVEDLGSTNGTSLNGRRLGPGEKAALSPGDKVSLGGFELVFSLPGEGAKTLMAAGGRTAAIAAPPTLGEVKAWINLPDGEQPLRLGTYTFGRKSDNDLVITDSFVSGRHGTIEVTDAGIVLTDTGSTNGTVVNDAKVPAHAPTQILRGDVIKLGSTEVTFRLKE